MTESFVPRTLTFQHDREVVSIDAQSALDVEQEQAVFASRLAELKFSEAAYRSAIPDINLIGELEGIISEFDKDLALTLGRQTAAENAVANGFTVHKGVNGSQIEARLG